MSLCSYPTTTFRSLSIPWHLSLHLLDRVFSRSRNYDILVLSDLAKGGLEIGECNYQKKTKSNVTKSSCLLFFRAVYHSKKSVIAAIKYFKTKKTTIYQSNSPNTITVENYRKIIINCDQVEFRFKMAAILDTILNTWTFWNKPIFNFNRLNH